VSTPEEPGDNPFAGIPLFGDLAKLVGQQGAASWDAATQLATSIASGGVSEPNVEPVERIKLEALQRLAEMAVEEATGLPLQRAGARLEIVPVNRTTWAAQAVRDYRPLFEKLAASLGQPPSSGSGPPGMEVEPGEDPMTAMLGGLMKMMAPMMLGMTAGSMVGHLAQRALGTYHLPIPRPPGGKVQLVVPSLLTFAGEWELQADDVRLWVCLSELTQHAVLTVPHVADRFGALLDEYVSGFRPDPNALEEAFGSLDVSSLGDVEGMRKLFGDPTVLLGAIRSPAQNAMLPRLEAVVAAVLGYTDHVMDGLSTRFLGSAGRLTEALRRRRVEATDADRFVERLLGLELTQAAYDRGAAFAKGVVERAGDAGLARLWADERNLPTPAEVDAPGLWLARLELAD
jgi:putative hydrolase